MSPEKQIKDGGQRQKIMIVVTVIVFLIVGYNVIGLFRGNSETATPVATAPAAANKTMNNPSSTTPSGNQGGGNKMAAASAAAGMPQVGVALDEPKQSRIVPNADILRLQSQTQTEYLTDLNDLQLLKVKREIAETKQAIAAAKLATITAETNIADSLISTPKGAPGSQPPPQPELNPNAPAVPIAPQNMTPIINYSVMSVSFQGQRWSAVIKSDTKLLNVNVGDSLPDGSIVQDISRNGVTIKRDTTTTKLTLPNTL